MSGVNREALSAYLDGELPAAERLAVERALAADEALRAEFEALRAVDGLFRAAGRAEAPAHLEESVRRAVHSPVTPMPAHGRVRWLRYAAPSVLAASALLVAGLAWRLQLEDTPPAMETAPAMAPMADEMRSAPEPPPPTAMMQRMSVAADAPSAGEDALGAGEVTVMASPPPPPAVMMESAAPAVVEAEGITLALREGRWVCVDYADEPLEPLARDDAAWDAFTAPEGRAVLRALEEPIVLRVDGAWRLVAALVDSTLPAPLE